MRPMNPITDAEDVLKTIEAAVIAVSRGHSEMSNYTALRAYEGAIAHYNALARGHQPKPVALSGLDGTTFEAVYNACEERLGKPVSDDPSAPVLNAEDLVACLRRLRKSVEFWTKQGGRRGYIDFVARFVS